MEWPGELTAAINHTSMIQEEGLLLDDNFTQVKTPIKLNCWCPINPSLSPTLKTSLTNP